MKEQQFGPLGITGEGIYSLECETCGVEPPKQIVHNEIEMELVGGRVIIVAKKRICSLCQEERNLQSKIDLGGGGM